MNYKLKVSETNRKNGKFLYQIIDENNNIISDRVSNREYVACTINGEFFFGRTDLVGKGDHGRYLKIYKENSQVSEERYNEGASKYTTQTYQEWLNVMAKRLNELSTIVYK
jgi:hypothetical protein